MDAAEACAAYNARVLRLKEATGLTTVRITQAWGAIQRSGLEELVVGGDKEAADRLTKLVLLGKESNDG